MPINDIYNLQIKGTNGTTQHIHSLNFRSNSPTEEAADLITDWEAGCGGTYRAMFAASQPLVQVIRAAKVCGSVPLPSPVEVVPAPAAQFGTRVTGANELMPSFMSTLVTVKGTLAGRRYNGRFFLGGLMENDCDSNTLSAAWIALVQAYVNSLKAVFVTPGTPNFKMFVFSKLLADGRPADLPNPGDPAVIAVSCEDAGSEVSNLIVSNRPTTTRSRKLGSGL